MKKSELIEELVTSLYESDLLNTGNYNDDQDVLDDVTKVIKNILYDYAIVKGEILE